MRVLFTSDWHRDAVTAGVRRSPELDRYVRRIVETVKSQSIDAVVHTGDFFDPGTMHAHELTAHLIEDAVALAETGASVVFIAGNHDVVETSGGWTTLSPLRVAAASFQGRLKIYVAERPGTFLLYRYSGCPGHEWQSGYIALLCLPYMARSADTVAEPWAEAFKTAKRLRDDGIPLVVAAHLTVPGAILGSETHEMRRGRDVDLPLEAIADLRPDLVVNGHYHRAQTVKGPRGIDVVIPGSPYRITFGEAADTDKGFVIADFARRT